MKSKREPGTQRLRREPTVASAQVESVGRTSERVRTGLDHQSSDGCNEAAADEYLALHARAPVPYLTLTRALDVCEINERASRLLDAADAIATRPLPSLRELLASSGALEACLDRVDRGEESARCRLHTQRADGRARVLEALVSAYGGPSSAPTRYLVVLCDVTELWGSLTELRQRSAVLQGMFDAAPDAIMLAAADGRLIDANPRAQLMFGQTRGELAGRSLDTFVRANGSLAEAEGMQRRTGCLLDAEIVRQNGATLPVQLSVSSFIVDRSRLLAVSLRDVGPQRLLERQLAHEQKMAAIGTLAAGIAHDFNNILMGIMGCAELALRRQEAGSSSARLLQDLLANAARAAALVRQLLDFGSKRARETTLVRIDDVVAASETLLRRVMPESISLRVLIQATEGWVVAEQGQIEQMLLNLAVNARDAMPRGGTLEVTTAILHVRGQGDRRRARSLPERGERRQIVLPPGMYVVLKVRDDGMGMDRDTQSRVFEPFFTTKGPGRGTGLGLASVFGIVKRLGGFVELESAPGQGTTFTFFLPKAAPRGLTRSISTVTSALVSTRPEPCLHKGTALLIEDEPLVLCTTRELLEGLGYRTLTAENGKVALELCRRHTGSIELLLTDVVMPGMGGREAADGVRSLHPEVKVLFMSGNDREVLVERGLLRDEDQVLPKPFSGSDLASCLENLFEVT